MTQLNALPNCNVQVESPKKSPYYTPIENIRTLVRPSTKKKKKEKKTERAVEMRLTLDSICSSRPGRFGLALHNTHENKENARPYVIREDSDTDSNDGQVLYREDYDDEKSEYQCKVFFFFVLCLSVTIIFKMCLPFYIIKPIYIFVCD